MRNNRRSCRNLHSCNTLRALLPSRIPSCRHVRWSPRNKRRDSTERATWLEPRCRSSVSGLACLPLSQFRSRSIQFPYGLIHLKISCSYHRRMSSSNKSICMSCRLVLRLYRSSQSALDSLSPGPVPTTGSWVLISRTAVGNYHVFHVLCEMNPSIRRSGERLKQYRDLVSCHFRTRLPEFVSSFDWHSNSSISISSALAFVSIERPDESSMLRIEDAEIGSHAVSLMIKRTKSTRPSTPLRRSDHWKCRISERVPRVRSPSLSAIFFMNLCGAVVPAIV